MGQIRGDISLLLSRPLPAGAHPARTVLRLADGYETSVYVYSPPASAARRTPVVYLHGIQSHPGWFSGSAADLAERGWPVYQVTRRGSGDNDADRGHAASAGQLLGDLAAACRYALSAGTTQDSTPPTYLAPGPASGPGAHTQAHAGPNSSPRTPPHPRAETLEGATQPPDGRVHLLGVSWGGKLAAAFAARTPGDVHLASLVLVAPGIAARLDLPTRTKLAVALAAVCCPRRPFDIPLNEVELFTDNEQMRAYLRGDERRLHRATARFLAVSRLLDVALGRAHDGALRPPTTLLLARRDRIIDNDRTRRIVERLTAGRAEVLEFDAAHTLEFEPDPQPFYQSLRAALDRAETQGQGGPH